ncbi:MAG: hypothetical protein ACKPIZ_29375, partial [Microcystis panniformis]
KRADYPINRQTLMVGFYSLSTNLENSFVSPSVPWQNPSIGGENAAWFPKSTRYGSDRVENSGTFSLKIR